MTLIKELNTAALEDFFQYLAMHIAENGVEGNRLFVPLSKENSRLSNELKSKFTEGLTKDIGQNGWRKTWIALNTENRIVGHLDLRSYNEQHATHRVLLGMGVDSNFRSLGIGHALLEYCIQYCKQQPMISWIDLEVLSHNTPAKRLYDKVGFKPIGKTKDRFRIDSSSYDYTSMALYVG